MTPTTPPVARRSHRRSGWRQTYAWITDEESDRLDLLADYWSASRAAVMRRALTAYLDAWREAERASRAELRSEQRSARYPFFLQRYLEGELHIERSTEESAHQEVSSTGDPALVLSQRSVTALTGRCNQNHPSGPVA